jgi:hypothetical protein
MRSVVCGIVTAGMILSVLSASDTATAPKKTTPKAVTKNKSVAHKTPATQSKTATSKSSGTAAHSTATAAHTAGTTGARQAGKTATASSKRGGKKTVARSTTWRNRQLAPTADRYREIQQAMVAKGYLKPEDVSGSWDANSADALKRFQAAQSLDATGKIDSLSIIALGLGPKRDTASAIKPATQPPPQTP